jgi:hypothetical protein
MESKEDKLIEVENIMVVDRAMDSVVKRDGQWLQSYS